MNVKFLIILFILNGANAVMGYDCGARQLNVTTLSLEDVGDRDIPDQWPNITQQYLQLLQINK